MRIAFWSNYPCSGVTSNMISLGAAMTLLYKAKIILTSNHHSMRDLGRCLTGNHYSAVVKEANPCYRNRNFFYPFENEKDSRLKMFIDSSGRYIPGGSTLPPRNW